MRRRHFLDLLAVLTLVGAVWFGPRVQVASGELPHELSDRAFWKLVSDFSEPGGYFRSDNLVSNETAFQHVIPGLVGRIKRGGVYLGVGPDQNFTYIAAFHPRMAFIIDIRRQNLLLHLMYKALIEMSDDRADFLSRLFSRTRPRGLGRATSPEELFTAYADVMPSEGNYRNNLNAIFDRLTKHHGFRLTDLDRQTIDDRIYRNFFASGPELRYSFPRAYGGAGVSVVCRADAADRRVRRESQLHGDRRELSGAAGPRTPQPRRAHRRRFRRAESHPARRRVFARPQCDRHVLLHVERRAVSVPDRRLAPVLRQRGHAARSTRAARSSGPSSTWDSDIPRRSTTRASGRRRCSTRSPAKSAPSKPAKSRPTTTSSNDRGSPLVFEGMGFKHILRRLIRFPTFTAITVATLGIGIGGNSAIFTVVEGVLLKPLPYPSPQELVEVDHAAPGMNIPQAGSAPFLHFTYRDQSHVFSSHRPVARQRCHAHRHRRARRSAGRGSH